MSAKNEEIFKTEIKCSRIFWGGEYATEGEDTYLNFILPFNIGDSITRDDGWAYVVADKDWDFETETVYFIMERKK